MDRTNVKIGQRVWFYVEYTGICSGIVEKVMDGPERCVKVDMDGFEIKAIQNVRLERCYPDEESLREALQREHDEKVRAYCDSIKTVENLVMFCYEHNFWAEEYTDYEAAKAARIRAKELLGLELG